ncbi:MAG: aspartate aminotransferase family protein [Acidobacteriota bacterium]|nr:aspartate aminotransferase family protein [Acidobacteriota bacterium]
MSSLAAVRKKESVLLVPLYDRYPLKLERGAGVYVYDDRGRKYLDFLSGIGVNALGYSHAAVRRTIAQMSARMIHVSNLFYTDYQAALAERLTKLSGLDRAFFCNSGTEAWEAALKFARAYAQSHSKNGHKPRWRVLAMQDAFHGRTFGSVACTWNEKYRKPFEPLLPGVEFVRFNDVADLTKKLDASVCAVGLEVVQGEGGIRPASKEFLRAARALTKQHGALLICDEIQSGIGRTGEMFAYQHYGIRPDIVTVAKPLAAGLPLGAVLVTNEVSRALHPGMHGTTFGGGPLACAVALTVLDVLARDGLVARNRRLGVFFQTQLEGLKKKHASVKEVRVLGLMAGLELDSADLAKLVVKQMLERGIIINRTHETALRMLPPYIVGKQHIKRVVATLDSILNEAGKMGHSHRNTQSVQKRSTTR